MKIKISNVNKLYWINYLAYWLIFALIVLITSGSGDGESWNFNLKFGLIATSAISSFILAHFVAKKFYRSEKIDELRIKEGLEYKEFNSKYGKLLDIIDK